MFLHVECGTFAAEPMGGILSEGDTSLLPCTSTGAVLNCHVIAS